ncbi:hypothetical protein ACP0HM_04955 [Escherichia coli]
MLVATICRAYHEKKGNAITAKWLVPVTKFRVRELAYLVLTLILVPTVVASLKAYTHVVCPVHLTIFLMVRCRICRCLIVCVTPFLISAFPAAHASSGFALFAFAFAPSLRRRRGAIIIVVMALGWAMGCYKMIIGDHFFEPYGGVDDACVGDVGRACVGVFLRRVNKFNRLNLQSKCNKKKYSSTRI